MSVGISTACFYPAATEEALRCVAEAGAKVTEVFFNSPSELEPDFLRRISSIALTAVSASARYIRLPRSPRAISSSASMNAASTITGSFTKNIMPPHLR